MKKRRIKMRLLPKFVVSLTILGVVLSIFISIFSYVNTGKYLENMYAQRVVFGAKSIADKLVFAGKIVIFSVSLPVLRALLSLIGAFLDLL